MFVFGLRLRAPRAGAKSSAHSWVSSADFDVIYYYSGSHFLFFGQISNYWAGQGPPPVGVVRQATWTAPPSFIAKAKESAKANEGAKKTAVDKEVQSGSRREETSEGIKGRTARTAQEFAG